MKLSLQIKGMYLTMPLCLSCQKVCYHILLAMSRTKKYKYMLCSFQSFVFPQQRCICMQSWSIYKKLFVHIVHPSNISQKSQYMYCASKLNLKKKIKLPVHLYQDKMSTSSEKLQI